MNKLVKALRVAAQREYFDRFLSTAILKVLFKVAFHPRLYRKRGIAEEGLRHGGKHDIAKFSYGRFRDFCAATPARRNPYLQFCFFGRVLFPEALPEYLSDEGLRRVRENHASIAWRMESYSRYIHLDHPLPEALRESIVRRDDRGEELVRSDRFPFYNLVVMELRR